MSMVLAQCRITCVRGIPRATQKPITKQTNQYIWCFMEKLESKVGQCSQSSGSITVQGLWRPTFHLHVEVLLPLAALPSAFSASPVLPLSPLNAPAQHSTALCLLGQRLDVISHGTEPGLWLPRHSPHSLQDRALPSDGS